MNESNIGGVSIRAILVLLLTLTFIVCLFMERSNQTIELLTSSAIAWYFGQRQQQ